MTRLWSQVLLALGLSVGMSILALRLSHGGPERGRDAIMELVMSTGLAHLHHELLASPTQADRTLEDWHRAYGLRYTLVPREAGSSPEPSAAMNPGQQLFFSLPLDGRTVDVGPFDPPIPQRTNVLIVILTFLATAMAAATAITVPLTRRLVVIDRAIASMEAGDLSVRVDDDTHDMLGRITTGFNHMASALERRLREREELLQAVAHEVSTPLARLQIHLEMLAKRLGPEHDARLNALRAEITNLDQLNEELVDWVRLDAPSPRGEDLDVEALVDRLVAAEVTPGPTIDWHPAGVPRWCSGHPLDVQRAVSNVIRNARRYAASSVQVRVGEASDAVVIEVHDDGPGIPPDQREAVFEPFARLEASRNRSTGGIGLGLAISRRSIERNGGRMLIEDSPLGGCLVRIRLSPMANEQRSPARG